MLIKNILISVGKEELPPEEQHLVLTCYHAVKQALDSYGFKTETLFVQLSDFSDCEQFKKKILSFAPDFIFNLFEGFDLDSFKEVEFIELIEQLNIGYSGNPSSALRLCLDKSAAKQALARNNLYVPKGKVVTDISAVDVSDLTLPLFIKPRCEDASLGIDEYSLLEQLENLVPAVTRKLQRHPKGLIIEEFINGSEYFVSFLGWPPYQLSGISLLDYSKYSQLKPYLSYDAKWTKTADVYQLMPQVVTQTLDVKLKEKIIQTAAAAGEALGCRGYFRVDMRQRKDDFFILDVNPNPDISVDSGFTKQAYARGLSYAEMIKEIVEQAIRKND